MLKLKRKPQYYLYRVGQKCTLPIVHYCTFLKLRYWGVQIGKRVRFFGFIKIVNMNKITIGDDTRIHSGYTNFVGAFNKTSIWAGQEAQINIGSNVGISNATIMAEVGIRIDSFVYIGGGTRIYDNDFHAIDREQRINEPGVIPSAPIHIKEGAFIGGHSIILKGVTIGENSVVGAGSLVTRDIPANEIWGGVPARKLKDL
jgi:acetyltransferase-like isoleucine patch superfamily enzyme